MSDQLELNPSGLTRSQFDRLSEFAHRAGGSTPDELLRDARQHLDQTQAAHVTNRMINARLASAIVEVIERVVGCAFLPWANRVRLFCENQYVHSTRQSHRDVLAVNICNWLRFLDDGCAIGLYWGIRPC